MQGRKFGQITSTVLRRSLHFFLQQRLQAEQDRACHIYVKKKMQHVYCYINSPPKWCRTVAYFVPHVNFLLHVVLRRVIFLSITVWDGYCSPEN